MGSLLRGLLGDRITARAVDGMTVRAVRYRAGHEMARHAHNFAGVSLVMSGTIVDMFDGGSAVCQALTLIYKPAGSEHATRIGPEGAATIHVELSEEIARRLSSSGVVGPIYVRAGAAAGGLLAYLDGARKDTDLADVLLGALGGGHRGRAIAESLAAHAFASRAICGPTAASAAGASMHPVSFARRFRRSTGLSPTEWRSRQRISHAASALSFGSDPLARVAHSAGFSDQAHLCREFKRETGLTPGEFRGLGEALGASRVN